jgi:hypothetical protein
MSGLAPITVYLSFALLGVVGLVWLGLRIAERSSRPAGIAFASMGALCFGFLALDKFVGVGYAKGFYMAVALTLVVGLAAGLALRRPR